MIHSYEYRLDPVAFNELHFMLKNSIGKNQTKARNAMDKSNSEVITTESRLGATLIMLADCRSLENMRSHRLAKSIWYDNFRAVIQAIHDEESLDITYDTNLSSIVSGLESKSSHSLFKYVCDCLGKYSMINEFSCIAKSYWLIIG